MEVKKSIMTKHPTVQYGSVDIFTSVSVSDADFDLSALQPADRFKYLDQVANWMVGEAYKSEHAAVQANLMRELVAIIPDTVRVELVKQGLLK